MQLRQLYLYDRLRRGQISYNELLHGFVAPDTTTLSTDANGIMSAVTAPDDDFNAYLGI